MGLRILVLLVASCFSITASALEPEDDAVFVRVIDTGAGHAAVVQMPGNHFMVYDTGHWTQDTLVFNRVQEVIPTTEHIDLMVLSHSDSDHLAATDEIFGAYTVDKVLRGGLERETGTWGESNTAITTAADADTTVDLDLGLVEFPDGATYRFGDTWVTKISGAYWPPAM